MTVPDRIDSTRRRLALALAALPAACATPQFLPPPSAPIAPPRVRVGDRWRYELRNAYNGAATGTVTQQVAELGSLIRLTSTAADGSRLPDEIYAGAWQVLQEAIFDVVQVYERPMPLVTDVLVGAGENSGIYYGVPEFGPRRFWWSQWRRSVGWERVTVPAGSFDCLRVERQIAFQHSDIFRSNSTRIDRLWYAPQVNRWVRREWTGQYQIGGGRRTYLREDAVVWALLEHVPAPVATRG